MHYCTFIFCNPHLGYKSQSISHVMLKNIHYHHSACYIVGFLRQYIYTFKHTHGDGSFYFVCIQNQPLSLLLHGNTCRIEHFDYKNLSWCIFSKFLAYYECVGLLLVMVLLWKFLHSRFYSRYFYEAPSPGHQKLMICI